VVEQIAIPLDRARAEVVPLSERGCTGSVKVTHNDRRGARRVFRAAAEEADALKHPQIGLAHLLLGVLREPDCMAARVLHRTGMRLQSVRDDIVQLLNEEPM
jgi:ATP-dependent Clp protease ATP-binding subunit ClpC